MEERNVLNMPLCERWKVYPSMPRAENDLFIIMRISESLSALSGPTISKSHWMNSL